MGMWSEERAQSMFFDTELGIRLGELYLEDQRRGTGLLAAYLLPWQEQPFPNLIIKYLCSCGSFCYILGCLYPEQTVLLILTQNV